MIVRYRPDHFWEYSWINNGYDIPTQHVVWARDTEPVESSVPPLCTFKDRQVWVLMPPETGFIPPPDRTAAPTPAPAAVLTAGILYARYRFAVARLNL